MSGIGAPAAGTADVALIVDATVDATVCGAALRSS